MDSWKPEKKFYRAGCALAVWMTGLLLNTIINILAVVLLFLLKDASIQQLLIPISQATMSLVLIGSLLVAGPSHKGFWIAAVLLFFSRLADILVATGVFPYSEGITLAVAVLFALSMYAVGRATSTLLWEKRDLIYATKGRSGSVYASIMITSAILSAVFNQMGAERFEQLYWKHQFMLLVLVGGFIIMAAVTLILFLIYLFRAQRSLRAPLPPPPPPLVQNMDEWFVGGIPKGY